MHACQIFSLLLCEEIGMVIYNVYSDYIWGVCVNSNSMHAKNNVKEDFLYIEV